MQLIVTSQAKKQLKKLPKFSQLFIIEKLKKIETDPFVSAKKLGGYKDAFRIRVGDYRIVYRIIKKKIYIVLIGHRKDIYRLVERLLK